VFASLAEAIAPRRGGAAAGGAPRCPPRLSVRLGPRWRGDEAIPLIRFSRLSIRRTVARAHRTGRSSGPAHEQRFSLHHGPAGDDSASTGRAARSAAGSSRLTPRSLRLCGGGGGGGGVKNFSMREKAPENPNSYRGWFPLQPGNLTARECITRPGLGPTSARSSRRRSAVRAGRRTGIAHCAVWHDSARPVYATLSRSEALAAARSPARSGLRSRFRRPRSSTAPRTAAAAAQTRSATTSAAAARDERSLWQLHALIALRDGCATTRRPSVRS